MTTSEAHFDRREMLMPHDMFRREFTLMPRLVRDVAAGDAARAQIVADHITGVSTVLHHHHRGEDEQGWPLLLERGQAEAAPLLELMERQHKEIEDAASEVDTATRVWRASAASPDRDALAGAIDRLLPLLTGHMRTEEEHVVPLMERYITAAEWNRMVQAGSADVDPESLPLAFGMAMYEGDPEIVDAAIANMPPDARTIIRKLAVDAFAAHSERIHGTATPPRSTEL
ncbi:hemerythrin domain-containing protein [Pseudonocardia sp. CA-142604]|uniref:hemerythrin domain-containing protein n=1 Tax=Pseudonocardia sp. CA-142604 TaxID=3240024 RepID=UPI003D8CA3E4